jgi:hypothetical protein
VGFRDLPLHIPGRQLQSSGLGLGLPQDVALSRSLFIADCRKLHPTTLARTVNKTSGIASEGA